MEFVKVQGLGNDFLVFDEPNRPTADQIRAWCNRRTGVGADGVLVIAPVTEDRVSMRYWNADGGAAEMCGNGLRCIAKLAHQRGWVSDREFIVESAVGDHPVRVGTDAVKAFVGIPRGYRTETLSVADQDIHPLSIGNPHAIIFVDDVDSVDVATIGSLVERAPIFPDGTNVEFVQVPVPTDGDDSDEDPDEFAGLMDGTSAPRAGSIDAQTVRARIWERGVGETDASGTGATASAYLAHKVHGVEQPVTVHLRGGELLVTFDDAGAWMEGPAEIVFEGSIAQ